MRKYEKNKNLPSMIFFPFHSHPPRHRLSLSLCSFLSLFPLPSNAVLRHKRRTQSRQREVEGGLPYCQLTEQREKENPRTRRQSDRRLGLVLREVEGQTVFLSVSVLSSWKVIFLQQTQWKEVSKLVFALLTLS